ncbi:MAG: hypothetical protein AAGJ12_11650 [Bacteroidota bacterium]
MILTDNLIIGLGFSDVPFAFEAYMIFRRPIGIGPVSQPCRRYIRLNLKKWPYIGLRFPNFLTRPVSAPFGKKYSGLSFFTCEPRYGNGYQHLFPGAIGCPLQ